MVAARVLLDLLTPAARLALPYVSSMVESGLSANAIGRALTEAGLGIRRTDLLELVRGLREVEITRPYVSSLRADFLPNPSRLAESVTTLLRSFSYTVQVEGTHLETGELFTKNITVSTDDLLTKEQAVNAALEIADTALDRYGFSAHGGRVTMIKRSPGALF